MSLRRIAARLLGCSKEHSRPNSSSSSAIEYQQVILRPHTSHSLYATPVFDLIPVSALTSAFDQQLTPEVLSEFLIWYLYNDLLRPEDVCRFYAELRNRAQWIRMGHELGDGNLRLPRLQCICESMGLDYETVRLRMARLARMNDLSSSEMAGYHVLGGYDADRLMLQYNQDLLQKCRPKSSSVWASYRYSLAASINSHLQVVTSLLLSTSSGSATQLPLNIYQKWVDVLQLQIQPPDSVRFEAWEIHQQYQDLRRKVSNSISHTSNHFKECPSATFYRAMMRRMAEERFSGNDPHSSCPHSPSESIGSSTTLISAVSQCPSLEHSSTVDIRERSPPRHRCATGLGCRCCNQDHPYDAPHSRSPTPVQYYRNPGNTPESPFRANENRRAPPLLALSSRDLIFNRGPFELEA